MDPRVSGDAKVACVDCHLFDKGGSDGKPTPLVGARPPGIVNSPSVFNLAYDYRYGWGAKFATLEDQHDANIKNPLTMATTWEDAAARLRADATYARSFEEAYRSGLTPDNLRDALISYELSLTTPNARFDRFLRGDASAIDDRARQGYALFKSYGCVSCHQGVNVGGNLMERFGVMRDYFAARGHVSDADDGHFAATHDERDRHVFRVPSLRNVALTAPYFHDGSAATLPDAIGVMARYQLGRTLEPDDVARIVAFLETLTGDQPTPPARP